MVAGTALYLLACHHFTAIKKQDIMNGRYQDGLVVAAEPPKDMLDLLCEFTEQVFCREPASDSLAILAAVEPTEERLEYVFQTYDSKKKTPGLTQMKYRINDSAQRPAVITPTFNPDRSHTNHHITGTLVESIYCLKDPQGNDEEEEKSTIRGSQFPLIPIDSQDSFHKDNVIINTPRAALEKNSPAPVPETHLYFRPERQLRECKYADI
jgi:hypothetical protein